ncbi:MAG: acyl-CoA dehydrogenase family protein [Myxococcota bacterium]|nr:acyl-CoA dehydrogenase family protein [Myxococcota bacterium]
MHFAFNEEQEELREQARAFLADHSSPEDVRRAMESERGWDADVWKRIGSELGWPAVVVPEAYGGLGLTWVELTALQEVMGEALLCSPFFSTVCLGGTALIVAGSEEQKQQHLPGIAEGQTLATLAFTEPSGRWDAAGVEAVARRDGGGFVLSGTKRFVPDGHTADVIVVAARAERSEGESGLSLFCVAGDAPGLEREALPTMDQTRRQAQLELRDVRVPASALMGEEGGGWPGLRRTLDLAAVALAAEQVGGAQRCLDLAVAYAKERVQFGRPIGSFQSIKHKCADMMLAVESARSAAYYAACVAAEGSPELSLVASLAQATGSDAYFRCAGECIQIFGGVGFTWEYEPHLYFKRARSSETLLGDAAFHRERVAQQVLDRA